MSHQEPATERTNPRPFLLLIQVSSNITHSKRTSQGEDYVNPFQYHKTHQPCVGDITHYLPDFKTIHKTQPI